MQASYGGRFAWLTVSSRFVSWLSLPLCSPPGHSFNFISRKMRFALPCAVLSSAGMVPLTFLNSTSLCLDPAAPSGGGVPAVPLLRAPQLWSLRLLPLTWARGAPVAGRLLCEPQSSRILNVGNSSAPGHRLPLLRCPFATCPVKITTSGAKET